LEVELVLTALRSQITLVILFTVMLQSLF